MRACNRHARHKLLRMQPPRAAPPPPPRPKQRHAHRDRVGRKRLGGAGGRRHPGAGLIADVEERPRAKAERARARILPAPQAPLRVGLRRRGGRAPEARRGLDERRVAGKQAAPVAVAGGGVAAGSGIGAADGCARRRGCRGGGDHQGQRQDGAPRRRLSRHGGVLVSLGCYARVAFACCWQEVVCWCHRRRCSSSSSGQCRRRRRDGGKRARGAVSASSHSDASQSDTHNDQVRCSRGSDDHI